MQEYESGMPFDSGDLLYEGMKNRMKVDPSMMSAVGQEFRQGDNPYELSRNFDDHYSREALRHHLHGDRADHRDMYAAASPRNTMSNREIVVDADTDTSTYEEGIVTLLDIKDDLEGLGQAINIDSFDHFISPLIYKIQGALDGMGIEYTPFDPLSVISGLNSGIKHTSVNVKHVIENTKRNYTLFEIKTIEPLPINDKMGIVILLSGSDKNGDFEVKGVVLPKFDFSGNEAIDFVLIGDKGRLCVRAYEDGRWKDVSGNFHINHSVFDAPPEETPPKTENKVKHEVVSHNETSESDVVVEGAESSEEVNLPEEEPSKSDFKEEIKIPSFSITSIEDTSDS